MRNRKQVLMKSEIFFKEPPMVCMNQECCGILIFLANSPLNFAWTIGIYGKPIFWTSGISKNPLTPSKSLFRPQTDSENLRDWSLSFSVCFFQCLLLVSPAVYLFLPSAFWESFWSFGPWCRCAEAGVGMLRVRGTTYPHGHLAT